MPYASYIIERSTKHQSEHYQTTAYHQPLSPLCLLRAFGLVRFTVLHLLEMVYQFHDGH